MRIAWESRGEGDPVLMIHGLGYARWGWEPVAEPLARRFRLLLFDNRGIGESEVPPGPYTAAAMAEDALAVLDEAGVPRAPRGRPRLPRGGGAGPALPPPPGAPRLRSA